MLKNTLLLLLMVLLWTGCVERGYKLTTNRTLGTVTGEVVSSLKESKEQTAQKIKKMNQGVQNEIQQQAKLITKTDILMTEATTIANDTIRSLKSNLNFLTKIRTDSTFRNCAIQKDNLSKMNILKDSAKDLFDDREITRTQYHNYIKKLKSEMQNLNNTIHKTCKNEG